MTQWEFQLAIILQYTHTYKADITCLKFNFSGVGGDILLKTGEEEWDEELWEGRPGGG